MGDRRLLRRLDPPATGGRAGGAGRARGRVRSCGWPSRSRGSSSARTPLRICYGPAVERAGLIAAGTVALATLVLWRAAPGDPERGRLRFWLAVAGAAASGDRARLIALLPNVFCSPRKPGIDDRANMAAALPLALAVWSVVWRPAVRFLRAMGARVARPRAILLTVGAVALVREYTARAHELAGTARRRQPGASSSPCALCRLSPRARRYTASRSRPRPRRGSPFLRGVVRQQRGPDDPRRSHAPRLSRRYGRCCAARPRAPTPCSRCQRAAAWTPPARRPRGMCPTSGQTRRGLRADRADRRPHEGLVGAARCGRLPASRPAGATRSSRRAQSSRVPESMTRLGTPGRETAARYPGCRPFRRAAARGRRPLSPDRPRAPAPDPLVPAVDAPDFAAQLRLPARRYAVVPLAELPRAIAARCRGGRVPMGSPSTTTSSSTCGWRPRACAHRGSPRPCSSAAPRWSALTRSGGKGSSSPASAGLTRRRCCPRSWAPRPASPSRLLLRSARTSTRPCGRRAEAALAGALGPPADPLGPRSHARWPARSTSAFTCCAIPTCHDSTTPRSSGGSRRAARRWRRQPGARCERSPIPTGIDERVGAAPRHADFELGCSAESRSAAGDPLAMGRVEAGPVPLVGFAGRVERALRRP